MCPAAIAISEQLILALSFVQLIEGAETLGGCFERLDERIDAGDLRRIRIGVVADPFAVSIQRRDVVLRRFIGAGERESAAGAGAGNISTGAPSPRAAPSWPPNPARPPFPPRVPVPPVPLPGPPWPPEEDAS